MQKQSKAEKMAKEMSGAACDAKASKDATQGLQYYLVGGAVRDQLLQLPVRERDYVVVGATPEEMTHRGFKPVGRDFPVFLHPVTHEEYALARTERKTGRGYLGFVCYTSPEIRLEDDLLRRDLTINAMAMDEVNGRIIDPYGGQADLMHKILRHVSPAFVEDPVRVLRLARFAARFAGFVVAPETMRLMQQMVADGEVNALVAERVLQEFLKVMLAAQVDRFFEVLAEAGALPILFPELYAHYGEVLVAARRGARVDNCELARRYFDGFNFQKLVIDKLAEDERASAGRVEDGCIRFGDEFKMLVRFASIASVLDEIELHAWRRRHNLSRQLFSVAKVAIMLRRWLMAIKGEAVNEMRIDAQDGTRTSNNQEQLERYLCFLEECDGFRRPELLELAMCGILVVCEEQEDRTGCAQRLLSLLIISQWAGTVKLTTEEIATEEDKRNLKARLHQKRLAFIKERRESITRAQ